MMRDDQMISVLKIADHPFYIGLVNPGEGHELPCGLPFELGVHPQYAIPRLAITENIRTALSKAYSAGSMASTPLGESPLAVVRMNEVLQKLLLLFKGEIEEKKFLEIGCGNGELLNQLKLRGAIVTGLEIGPQAQVVEDRYGIQVLREPLSVESPVANFDCIYSYGCLEHIEGLDEFFAGSRACLSEGGLFFHSVPNAALSFEQARVDHLLHEHVNYFTPENGVALLEAQGFCPADYALTKAGNELMLWGFYRGNAVQKWPVERVTEEIAMLSDYAEKVERKTRSTLEALAQMAKAGKSIGFYAGGFEYGFRLEGEIRYFDGDVYKHGKQWLQGLGLIEPPSALVAKPVDCLVICKPHYFPAIKNTLIDMGIDENCMINIDGLSQS